jgi:hypothetical protein
MNYTTEQELLVDRIIDDLTRKLKETDDELLLTNNRVDTIWHLRTFSELQEGEVSEWLADYCDPNLSLTEKTRYLRSEINRVITKLCLTEGAKI